MDQAGPQLGRRQANRIGLQSLLPRFDGPIARFQGQAFGRIVRPRAQLPLGFEQKPARGPEMVRRALRRSNRFGGADGLSRVAHLLDWSGGAGRQPESGNDEYREFGGQGLGKRENICKS